MSTVQILRKVKIHRPFKGGIVPILLSAMLKFDCAQSVHRHNSLVVVLKFNNVKTVSERSSDIWFPEGTNVFLKNCSDVF